MLVLNMLLNLIYEDKSVEKIIEKPNQHPLVKKLKG
jgi:hypothetical protein|tara:strand:- start:157 stop:264 length:108 start_codon:yes stop_codon:yes gene_type:complete